ncbi:hypothetical protein, partial [uncultured Dubosiella sp.]|uniref:hypothetical protein n=1 Tax=uncultured Dubosiella sp. TaxID=1937011 RepID=UPI0025B5D1AB
ASRICAMTSTKTSLFGKRPPVKDGSFLVLALFGAKTTYIKQKSIQNGCLQNYPSTIASSAV